MTDFNVYDLLISEYKHSIIIEEEDKEKLGSKNEFQPPR